MKLDKQKAVVLIQALEALNKSGLNLEESKYLINLAAEIAEEMTAKKVADGEQGGKDGSD